MKTLQLKAKPLTPEAFAAYGDVIQTEGAKHFSINAGTIERFHDLAQVDIGVEREGRPLVSIAQCNQLTSLPHSIAFVERHPLGTQAFIPLDDSPLVVAVAPVGEAVDPAEIEAFVSDGSQGVNYSRGVWHMPLISLRDGQKFVVVDRGGPGQNCDEFHFADANIQLTL